jgi:acyl carrier protein
MTDSLLALEISMGLQSVRQKIAELIHDNLDITVDRVLEDIPFPELHKDFDSLAMLEVQMLLETAYGFEFETNLHDKNTKLPNNATELALEVIRQHAQHEETLKIKAATLAAKQHAA